MGLGVLSSIACWSMVKCGAVAVTYYFHASIVLGALVGVPSLAHGAMGSSGWSFKSAKSWKSTLVYSAKIVYLLGILTAALMFYIFFLLIPLFVGYRGDETSIQCRVLLPSLAYHGLWTVTSDHCSMRVSVHGTQFLESLGDGSGLHGNREKLGLRQMQCPHKPRHI